MKELKSLRTQREKHFLKEDGSFEVKYFNEDIHYIKGKEYLEIDPTLKEEKNIYKNETNTFKIVFQKESPTCKVYEKDLYAQTSWEGFPLKKVKISKNEIKYIGDNIDIHYMVLNGKVKETIFLKRKEALKDNLKFTIYTNMEVKVENSRIKFQKDGEKYLIAPPYMMDQKNHKSNKVTYELINQNGNCYKLNLNVDKEWLNKASYPVMMDPTIINEKGENVYDVQLSSKLDPNKPYGTYYTTLVGSKEDEIGRALLKFVLPKLPSGTSIVKATGYLTGMIELYLYDYQTPHAIHVHEVKEKWEEETATWNNAKDNYLPKVLTYFYPNLPRWPGPILTEPLKSEFDLTKITKEWYGGKENKGILLKYNDEVYKREKPYYIFYNKERDLVENTAYRPYMTISYRLQKGLLDDMDYKEVVHQNGVSFINTYNGHVVTTFKTTKTISNKLPVSLTLIHNAKEEANLFGFGMGWRSNYNETLEEETIEEMKYLKYTTGTGAIHYFMKNEEQNVYLDEDGLNLKIKKENEKFIMIDKEGNQKEFTKNNNWYHLTKIKNERNDTVTISYNGEKITSITDASGKKITISYTNTKVTFTSDYDTSTITLENNKLKSIQNKMGTTTLEETENAITKIISPNSLGYSLHYLETQKLQKITEIGLNNEEGTSLELKYLIDETRITDNTGKQQVCLYDQKGRMVNEYFTLKENGKLEEMYGSFQGFLNGEENNKVKNKQNYRTSFIKYVNNNFTNSSFEEDYTLVFTAKMEDN